MESIPVERSRTSQTIEAAVSEDLKTIVKHGQEDMLYTRLSLPEKLPAPVRRGTILGTVSVFQGDEIIAETSLIAMNSAEKMELIDYIGRVVHEWLKLVCLT